MSKKQLTPEQYNEKMEKKALKAQSFSNAFTSFLAVLLAVVITFSVVSTAYTYAGSVKNNIATSNPDAQNTPDENMDISDDSSLTTDDSSASLNQETNNSETNDGAEDNNNDGEQADTPDNEKIEGFSTTAEMVAYFNECANKVKTEATKVVKNSEKRIVGVIKVPDVLQSMAEDLLKNNMKDDTEPIVYDTKEEIRDNFLVPNQDYVSLLTAADVLQATCKDNGKEYEIYFKLKDEKNPTAGKGVAAVCDVIEAEEIAAKAPSFLKEFSTYYRGCEVKATIDKATGRMTHAIYSTPVTLNVVVELFGTHSASVELTFVKDFSITY